MRKYTKVRNCKHCGNEFNIIGSQSYYCSIECNIKDNITVDENDCWNWTGYKMKNGYGQVNYNSKKIYIHRAMCEHYNGISPDDKPFVLHSCDNTTCCNPNHLRWGSPQDNMDDMKERNRSINGEKHGGSKLTEEQVIEIIDKLKNYKHGDYAKLAQEYNVNEETISLIHNNKRWKHISRNGETK